MFKFFLVFFVAFVVASAAPASQFDFSWDPPIVDDIYAPAAYYIVQTSPDATEWATVDTVFAPVYSMELEPGAELYLRVAAASAEGFLGPWSEPSDLLKYTVPGQPGKPTWIHVLIAGLGLIGLLIFSSIFRRNHG